MVSAHLKQAYDELRNMDNVIAESKANIRVLESMQYPGLLEVKNNLAKAEQKRADFMRAIETEVNNPS